MCKLSTCGYPDRPVLAKGLCKSCYQLEWYRLHPESRYKHNATARKLYWEHHDERLDQSRSYGWHKLGIVGMTTARYDEMLKRQGGKCAFCGRLPIAKKRLAVDHDHDTGQVRWLLCSMCNHVVVPFLESLGLIDEVARRLIRAGDSKSC